LPTRASLHWAAPTTGPCSTTAEGATEMLRAESWARSSEDILRKERPRMGWVEFVVKSVCDARREPLSMQGVSGGEREGASSQKEGDALSESPHNHHPLFRSSMAHLLAARIGLLSVSTPRISFPRCFSETSDGPRVAPLSPEKTQILRDWAEKFKDKELDKTIAGCDIRYDRAGGAGGQVSISSELTNEGRSKLTSTSPSPRLLSSSERQQGQHLLQPPSFAHKDSRC
jgi:hypothetical protein